MRGKYFVLATFQHPKYLVGKIDHPLAGSGFQAHVQPRGDNIGTLGSGEEFPGGEHSDRPIVQYLKCLKYSYSNILNNSNSQTLGSGEQFPVREDLGSRLYKYLSQIQSPGVKFYQILFK